MDINEIRRQIDNVDDEMTELFVRRMELSLEAAEAKRDENTQVYDGGREREILARVTKKAGRELESYTRLMYTTLFDISRAYQYADMDTPGGLRAVIGGARVNEVFPKRASVACQGVEGAYSQQACDKLFLVPEIMYVQSFGDVFAAVEKGLCKYGVLPLENSAQGSVDQVYDLMRRHKFSIVRSARLHVDHSLMALPGVKLGDIREIVSHEQALGQCARFTATIKGARTVPAANTASAAKELAASGARDRAVISAKSCAALYGLEILADSVSDSDNNYTRFICIAAKPEIYPGTSRVSLMLSVAHRPGALHSLLGRFAALGINVSKIESRPIPGSDFDFMFYFDLDASIDEDGLVATLCQLERELDNFVFLGAYAEA